MKNKVFFTPVHSYSNADLQKSVICKYNNNKTGIYKWTHIISGKSYIGSARNLSKRFKNYYNITYLEKTKNNSMICKVLLKYGYSNFKLDILEYCNPNILIKREQHYFDLLKPEYNNLKLAKSIEEFEHSEEIINTMYIANNNTEAQPKIMDIANNNAEARSIIVSHNTIGKNKKFTSIAKTIKINKIYVKKLYNITKK